MYTLYTYVQTYPPTSQVGLNCWEFDVLMYIQRIANVVKARTRTSNIHYHGGRRGGERCTNTILKGFRLGCQVQGHGARGWDFSNSQKRNGDFRDLSHPVNFLH